jgi:hypothetical protein
VKTAKSFRAGLVICAVLGVFDIISLAGMGSEDGPPAAIAILGAVLGVATLYGVWLAWRHQPRGVEIVIVTRVLSALLGLPVFFVDDVPDGVPAVVAVAIVLTIVAVALVWSGRQSTAGADH